MASVWESSLYEMRDNSLRARGSPVRKTMPTNRKIHRSAGLVCGESSPGAHIVTTLFNFFCNFRFDSPIPSPAYAGRVALQKLIRERDRDDNSALA